MSDQPARRRWFQFGMRGLLVGLTLLALIFTWGAYNLSWLRQRRAVIEDFQNWSTLDWEPMPSAPGLLWIFGEKGYAVLTRTVHVNHGTEATDEVYEEMRRIQVLFPESSIELAVFSKDQVKPLPSRSMH
jgi:hypothetical protein